MEGRFNGGFLRYEFGGGGGLYLGELIHGGAYFRTFTGPGGYYGNQKVKKAASLMSKAKALQVHRAFCLYVMRNYNVK